MTSNVELTAEVQDDILQDGAVKWRKQDATLILEGVQLGMGLDITYHQQIESSVGKVVFAQTPLNDISNFGRPLTSSNLFYLESVLPEDIHPFPE